MKKIKLESVYSAAYADRYRRLGYEVEQSPEEEEDGKKYITLTLRRDRDGAAYARLAELENEVDELCRQAKEHAGEPDESVKKHKIILWVIFGVGCLFMAAGVALVVTGLLISNLTLALCGWGGAIAGAVLVIVWSCLREKWRLRRIDIADDAAHPGFGIDEYSKKVEQCLKLADEELSALAH